MNRILEAMDFESDTKNWKGDFTSLSRRYGRDFIETLKAMWQANGGSQTEKEFCEMNNLPENVFQRVIKQ
jgi:hypothetical protein